MNKINLGFTLIEMMITVSVLAILMAIAVPNYNNTLNSIQLNRDYKNLLSVLSTARNQALTLKQDVTVRLNSDDQDTATTFHWKAKQKNIYQESSSVQSLVFTSIGTVKNFNASQSTLTICNSYLKKSKRLQVTRIGSITSLADGSCT